MATIIDCGDGSFIAGDPPETLPEGTHWCTNCGGEGVIVGASWGDQLRPQICDACYGTSTEPCAGTGCVTCGRLLDHRFDELKRLIFEAIDRAKARGDIVEQDRLSQRYLVVARVRNVRFGTISLYEARLATLGERYWSRYERALADKNYDEVERQWARWVACNKRLDGEVPQ